MPLVQAPAIVKSAVRRVMGVAAAPAKPATRAYREIPPLRSSPRQEDDSDSQRVEYVRRLFHSQDQLLRARDRQIEENVRILCGQHWSVWSDVQQKFVDITRYLTDADRRWRQFPVLNRALLWYMLMHARMTENTPIIGFQPSTGDRADADLAEVMQTVLQTIWRSAGMTDVIDRLTAWLIPGGSSFLKSRIDRNGGDLRTFIGPAILSLLGPTGRPILGPDGQPIERQVPNVPYDLNGVPQARLTDASGAFEVTGQPYTMREGQIVVDALSPLEVRGEWGAGTPWDRKSWHIHRSFLTPEQFYEAYGIDTEPEVMGADTAEIAELQRLMYGSGFFGAADGRDGLLTAGEGSIVLEGLIPVYEAWFRPSHFPGMEETQDSAGGRLLTVTSKIVVRDGARTARFPHTSPIRRCDFVGLPGRPSGTSPQEMLNGVVRTRDRVYAQIVQHTNLVSNPTKLVDRNCGIKDGQLTNRPGETVYGDFRGVDKAVQFVIPPQLSRDVYEALALLTKEFDQLGNIEGGMGNPPTSDSSGKLVEELRLNSDRFIGPTQMRTVTALGGMVEDWIQLIPTIWDQQKVLKVAGDDDVVRTITVMPQMFEGGKVDVVPQLQSMLPETREAKLNRIWKMYEAGVFGLPGSPQAINVMLDQANFPDMDRAVRPGGIDRSTAEQNTAKLLAGAQAQQIPVFEWYDHALHLAVLERYMKSPEYTRQPWQIAQQFVLYREKLLGAQLAAAQRQMLRTAAVEQTAAALAPPGAAPGAPAGAGGPAAPPRPAAPAKGAA